MNHYARIESVICQVRRFKEDVFTRGDASIRRNHPGANSLSLRSGCGPVGNVLADGRRTGAASTKKEEKGNEEEGPWMRTVNSEMGQ